MDSIDPVITPLMAKYARREPLTPEELQLLEAWWAAAPENRELADLVSDEKWVEEAFEIMDEAPEEEMWEDFSRRLDEKQGIVRPAPFWSFRMQWPALLRGVAVAGLLFLAVRAIWLLTRKVDFGIAPLESVSAPRPADPVVGGQPVAPSVVGGLLAHTHWRNNDAENGRIDDREVPLKRDGNLPAKQDGDVSMWQDGPVSGKQGPVPPKQRVTRYAPATTPVDKDNLYHYCSAVVPPPSADSERMEHTIAYPYSYSAEALLTILSKLEGPTEIHFNGKQMRVAGTRRFEKAGVDAAVKKGAAPVAPSPGFHFNDTRLEQVLVQVAEWYGLKVSNPKGLRGVAITGELQRSSRPDSVLSILQMLEEGHAQLRLEQNTIVVSGWPGASGGP